MILTDVIQSRVVRDFLCILMTLMTDGSVFYAAVMHRSNIMKRMHNHNLLSLKIETTVFM